MVLIKPFGLIVTIVIMFAMVACGGSIIIEKTESSSEVSFSMSGTGNITIDWGDGTREKHELGDGSNFSHEYSGESVRTVTIKGKNVTHLDCSKKRLTPNSFDLCSSLPPQKVVY